MTEENKKKVINKGKPALIKGKVKAIEKGYYKGKIIEAGESFVYEGPVNKSGGFPLWVEVLQDMTEKKQDKKEAKAEKEDKSLI